LIRREISAGGRGRVFINDKLATLSLLKSTGDSLADIHGQHDQKSFMTYQATWNGLIVSVKMRRWWLSPRLFQTLREIALKLETHEMNEQERLQRLDMLGYQINEIRKANLRAGDKESLEMKRTYCRIARKYLRWQPKHTRFSMIMRLRF